MHTKKKMKVLVACEESQAVTKSFRDKGHEAYSCDLLPCSGGFPEWHLQEDAVKMLNHFRWDLVIAHPPCTVITNSGVRWLVSNTERSGFVWHERIKKFVNYERFHELYEACSFFNKFIDYFIKGNKGAIENPIPHMYAVFLLHDRYKQIIHPYQFGHTEKKATCLWLYGVTPLVETNNVYNEMMKLPYAERCKIHYASPCADRQKLRSKTYAGIAKAMSEQWG